MSELSEVDALTDKDEPRVREEADTAGRRSENLGASGGGGGENGLVDLARVAWLSVVLACVIAVLILVLNGYYGYATVTIAVAASAAINLR